MIERLLRELAPQVLGAVMRRHRDFAAAEEAVQDALLAASTRWPSEGTPDDPRAWLIQVAARKVTDQKRSEIARRRRENEIAIERGELFVPYERDEERDDSLLLLFMSCHPSLTPASAIALTLRAIGGLTTAEIASAFLVPEATMAQRISRAKQTIKTSGIAFAEPSAEERARRLDTVLHILYLIFNEGYASSGGSDVVRVELSSEAIRLARLVHRLSPEPEVAGLLALMLLTDARRPARTSESGDLISLAEQDRTRWDRALIREGTALLEKTLPLGRIGPYQLQAAIAAVHDEAPSEAETDWAQILALYGLLRRIADSPVVMLNEAVALAMVKGPRAGLAAVAALERDEKTLAGHHRLHAVRAHLHERAGDVGAAIEAYRAAAARANNVPERTYLAARAERLEAATSRCSRSEGSNTD